MYRKPAEADMTDDTFIGAIMRKGKPTGDVDDARISVRPAS